MIENRYLCQVHRTPHRTGPGVRCPENQGLNPGMDHGSITHGAGFQSHIQGGSRKPVVSEDSSSLPKGENFSMGGRVAQAHRSIVGLCQSPLTVSHQDGSHRYLQFLVSLSGLIQRHRHPVVVSPTQGPLLRGVSTIPERIIWPRALSKKPGRRRPSNRHSNKAVPDPWRQLPPLDLGGRKCGSIQFYLSVAVSTNLR